MLQIVPIRAKTAREFIAKYHRHKLPPAGWIIGLGVSDGNELVGVATIGRPVARYWDDGYTAELTRVCTNGYRNAASMLYGAAWRVVKNLGYKRLITYTKLTEPGTSLKASGYKILNERAGGESWKTHWRPGKTDDKEQKKLWEKSE